MKNVQKRSGAVGNVFLWLIYAYKNVLEPMGHLGANLIFSILTLNQVIDVGLQTCTLAVRFADSQQNLASDDRTDAGPFVRDRGDAPADDEPERRPTARPAARSPTSTRPPATSSAPCTSTGRAGMS